MIASSSTRSSKKFRKASPNAMRLIIWGGLTIFVVALSVIPLLPNEESTDEYVQKKRTHRIKETTLAKAMRLEPAQQQEKAKTLPPQRVGELRDGYRLLPDGTLHRVLGIVTNTPPKMSLADKTFTHSADVELGNLLMIEPGDDLLGSAEGMYTGFSKELDEALEEPITYDKDDTEVQRELKNGVMELRAELKARRNAGENIEKVMEDTWNQLKELSLYRQELEDQVRQLSTDELTQKDYEDLVAAANQMLSERGIKPLEMPATLKHILRLRRIQEEAAKRQEDAKEAKTAP